MSHALQCRTSAGKAPSKFCTVNQSRTDTHPLNAGRSDRPFGGNSSFLQPSVAPARDEVERESTRLLRELEDYHKRNREQRKASDDQQRKIADQLLDKDSLRKRDGARSAGKVPLSQLLRDGEKVSTETFRRKVKELSDTSRSGYDVRIRRTPSPDIKYVLKLTPKPRLPSPPPQPQPEPRDRNAFNIAAKLEDLRAHLTSLQFKDDSDPVTDYILQVNELRQSYLRSGGNDPDVLRQLQLLQLEAESLRRQSLRETMRVASNRQNDAALRHLQQQNASLMAALTATRVQPTQPQPPPMLVPPTYFMPYPPVNPYASQLLNMLPASLTVRPVQTEYDQHLKAEIAALRAEVRALRTVPEIRPVEIPVKSPEPMLAPPEIPMQVGTYVSDSLGHIYTERVPDGNGIVLFYDFVAGLESRISVVRLVVSTFSGDQKMGDPYMMPSVDCTVSALVSSLAMISSRQPVQILTPRPDLFVLVELQAAFEGLGKDSGELATRGWLRIRVFDLAKLLIDGRFRARFHIPPVRPIIRDDELEKVATYGSVELFYRVARNGEDEAQTAAEDATPTYAHTYAVQPRWERILEEFALAGRSLGPGFQFEERMLNRLIGGEPTPRVRSLQMYLEERNHRFRVAEAELDADHVGVRMQMPPAPNAADKMKRLAFRVCFVKNAEAGLAKVRITVHEARTGHIIKAGDTLVSASTAAVCQSFKHAYHVFGQQEALFDEVDLTFDAVVIVRFYLKRQSARTAKKHTFEPEEMFIKHPLEDPLSNAEFGEEDLVGWTCIPLLVPRTSGTLVFPDRKHYSRPGVEYNMSQLKVLSGVRTLPLYRPPVCEAWQVPHAQYYDGPLQYPRYGSAKIRFRIMAEEYFLPDNMTSSTVPSQQLEYELVRHALWIPLKRNEAPKKAFFTSDGFDLYVDAARFLPDGVTVCKMYGELMNRKWQRFGPPISATQLLDSDIYHPQFDLRQEIRDPALPPSLTLLITLVTVDRFRKLPTILGYASLNIFCELGSDRQPAADQNVIQVALNEGAHQLRVYPNHPSRALILCHDWHVRDKQRPMPGASVLVRVVRAPIGPSGQPLETRNVPRGDWVRLGLIQAKPLYNDNVYYSFACEPWSSERAILLAHEKRSPVTAADSCRTLSQRPLASVEAIRDFVSYTLLPKMEVDIGQLPEWNTSYITRYLPDFGFKVQLNTVHNLPWRNFTLGHICLNPPGAFYMGAPYQNYDPVAFFTVVDLATSTDKMIIFRDPFKHFRFRSYTQHLTAIIQLHEVALTLTTESFQVQLLQHAWCAVPVFTDEFVRTETIVVPLFVGVPSFGQLLLLSQMPLDRFIQEMRQTNGVQLLGNAFAVVRVADGRRMEEMLESEEYNILRLTTTYVPVDLRTTYTPSRTGVNISTLVPNFVTQAEFEKNLAERFKEMVHLMYEVSPQVTVKKSSADAGNTTA